MQLVVLRACAQSYSHECHRIYKVKQIMADLVFAIASELASQRRKLAYLGAPYPQPIHLLPACLIQLLRPAQHLFR